MIKLYQFSDSFLALDTSTYNNEELFDKHGSIVCCLKIKWPNYVKVFSGHGKRGSTCLRLIRIDKDENKATYYRDGGRWDMRVKIDRINAQILTMGFSDKSCRNYVCVPVTRSEWAADNGQYADDDPDFDYHKRKRDTIEKPENEIPY